MTINMEDRVFGRLTVHSKAGFTAKSRQAIWLCACQCGAVLPVNGSSLRRGDTVSCGCFNKTKSITHGLVGTTEYKLWENAKNRARRLGREFSINPNDIHIPDRCPVLGIRLKKQGNACSDASPTIDRIDSSLGYAPGNIAIISHRANSIKRNATAEELELVAGYVRNGAGCAHEKVHAHA